MADQITWWELEVMYQAGRSLPDYCRSKGIEVVVYNAQPSEGEIQLTDEIAALFFPDKDYKIGTRKEVSGEEMMMIAADRPNSLSLIPAYKVRDKL